MTKEKILLKKGVMGTWCVDEETATTTNPIIQKKLEPYRNLNDIDLLVRLFTEPKTMVRLLERQVKHLKYFFKEPKYDRIHEQFKICLQPGVHDIMIICTQLFLLCKFSPTQRLFVSMCHVPKLRTFYSRLIFNTIRLFCAPLEPCNAFSIMYRYVEDLSNIYLVGDPVPGLVSFSLKTSSILLEQYLMNVNPEHIVKELFPTRKECIRGSNEFFASTLVDKTIQRRNDWKQPGVYDILDVRPEVDYSKTPFIPFIPFYVQPSKYLFSMTLRQIYHLERENMKDKAMHKGQKRAKALLENQNKEAFKLKIEEPELIEEIDEETKELEDELDEIHKQFEDFNLDHLSVGDNDEEDYDDDGFGEEDYGDDGGGGFDDYE